MCGISAFFSRAPLGNELQDSLREISHRGPDGSGFGEWEFDKKYFAGLGHVRLSILDLTEAGNQPMISCSGKVAMVFNGEIYNHAHLKKSIYEIGFRGHSDSEIFLEYYERYGVEGFKDLRGMFAAVFLHLDTGRMVIVRDSLGIKPLYYTRLSDGIFISSEIRGLMPFVKNEPQVSMEDLYSFMRCGFVYDPNTGFENIKKVPIGHYAEVSFHGVELKKYFSLASDAKPFICDEYFLVKQSIEAELESDVKMGIFFSGGIDSSVIAAHANFDALYASSSHLEEFSPHADEEVRAEKIAELFGINLDVIKGGAKLLDADEIIRQMKMVVNGSEELVSDFTYYSSYLISSVARKKGYKVMLSGMGGDEVFLGYPRYKLVHFKKYIKFVMITMKLEVLYRFLPIPKFLNKKYDRMISFLKSNNFIEGYNHLIGYFSENELIKLIDKKTYALGKRAFEENGNSLLSDFENDTPLIKAVVLDLYGFLAHNLTIADKSSMQAGIELRVPLVNKDLYCHFFGVLRKNSAKVTFNKIFLKEILKKWIPSKLLASPKVGFNPPINPLISLLGETLIIDELKKSKLSQYLVIDEVKRIVSEHFNGKSDNAYKIWQMLYFSYWLDLKRQKF
jgi:asparagine synthase (glutamine-hydrolysing)